MKRAKILLFSAVLLFIASVSLFSAETEVRVIVSKANIRLNPTTQSEILGTASLGAVYEVLKKEGNWYCIKFTTGQAVEIVGYIHQSLVEVFEEKKAETIERVPEEKFEEVQVSKREPQKKYSLSVCRQIIRTHALIFLATILIKSPLMLGLHRLRHKPGHFQ